MDEVVLDIEGVEEDGLDGPARGLRIVTDRGPIACVLHRAKDAARAVICVGGVGGGLDGPSAIYPRLGDELSARGRTVLRLAYRKPAQTEECLADVNAGIAVLTGMRLRKFALVGHSFGGEIVIRTAALCPAVRAVVAIASHRRGAIDYAPRLAPRPLLLLHGTTDTVVPDRDSREIFARAGLPKTLRLLVGADHVLSQAADEAFTLVRDWLNANFPATD
jgi:alpha-beta hydrolase superfamily lysophospholipase